MNLEKVSQKPSIMFCFVSALENGLMYLSFR